MKRKRDMARSFAGAVAQGAGRSLGPAGSQPLAGRSRPAEILYVQSVLTESDGTTGRRGAGTCVRMPMLCPRTRIRAANEERYRLFFSFFCFHFDLFFALHFLCVFLCAFLYFLSFSVLFFFEIFFCFFCSYFSLLVFFFFFFDCLGPHGTTTFSLMWDQSVGGCAFTVVWATHAKPEL